MTPSTNWTTNLGNLTGSTFAFAVVPIYGVLWFVLDRDSFDWHGITTLIYG